MVLFDQLRISDDGKRLYVDVHVNKASYFDNLTLKKVTICTEEQVSELNPKMYGEKFIYQKDLEPVDIMVPVYDEVQILSAQDALDALDGEHYGGLPITYTPVQNATENYLSIILSGKYSQFDTGYAPRLVVASSDYNPTEEGMNSVEILGRIDGEVLEEKGHRVWQFKGRTDLKFNTTVYVYLYAQTSEGEYEYVPIEDTDLIKDRYDKNATYNFAFLHILWQVYSVKPGTTEKEAHLLLTEASFNEAFNNTDEEGHAIDENLPIATEALSGGLSKHMFFVYVECEGALAPDTPCGLDEVSLGVTFDYGVIYNNAMAFTRELADSCQMPKGFIDFMLNTEALKLSLETRHYVPAINYWKWLTGANGILKSNSNSKGCGCHG